MRSVLKSPTSLDSVWYYTISLFHYFPILYNLTLILVKRFGSTHLSGEVHRYLFLFSLCILLVFFFSCFFCAWKVWCVSSSYPSLFIFHLHARIRINLHERDSVVICLWRGQWDWPTCIPISAITSFFSFLYSYRLTFRFGLIWIGFCIVHLGLGW